MESDSQKPQPITQPPSTRVPIYAHIKVSDKDKTTVSKILKAANEALKKSL